jgi:D-lactate dehydrogenase (cytochrome)
LITDVCVPISRLAECIVETRADLDSSTLIATIAGHVGDGNFHAFILVNPTDPQEVAQAEALHMRMGERAIRMDGTCTGEHGIGLGKKGLLVREFGDSVSVMRAIKFSLDPSNLLNPGKIFRSSEPRVHPT